MPQEARTEIEQRSKSNTKRCRDRCQPLFVALATLAALLSICISLLTWLVWHGTVADALWLMAATLPALTVMGILGVQGCNSLVCELIHLVAFAIPFLACLAWRLQLQPSELVVWVIILVVSTAGTIGARAWSRRRTRWALPSARHDATTSPRRIRP